MIEEERNPHIETQRAEIDRTGPSVTYTKGKESVHPTRGKKQNMDDCKIQNKITFQDIKVTIIVLIALTMSVISF